MKVMAVVAEMGSGGAEAVVLELTTGLVGRGFDVVVASAGGRRDAAVRASGGRTATVPLAGRSVVGVVRAQRTLRRLSAQEQPDVIHAHNVGATLSARLATSRRFAALPGGAQQQRPPLLTTFHGVAAGDYARAAQVLDRCSDHVVAVHQQVAERLRGAGLRRAPLTVVSNAISIPPSVARDTARTELGLPRDVPVALCAARLVRQKRHDVLLDAWSRLPGKPVLLLAGTGELAAEVARDVVRRGLQDRVRLLGERDDVPLLLAAADVFVLSSDWEGLPIALLEAMAAGVPVVATEVDGVGEALGDRAARLVPPGDPVALSAALAAVLGDAGLRTAMSAAGRQRATQRWSAPAMVEAYCSTYAELLRSRSGRRSVAT